MRLIDVKPKQSPGSILRVPAPRSLVRASKIPDTKTYTQQLEDVCDLPSAPRVSQGLVVTFPRGDIKRSTADMQLLKHRDTQPPDALQGMT